MARLTLACMLLLGGLAISMLPQSSLAQNINAEMAVTKTEEAASTATNTPDDGKTEAAPESVLPAELTDPSIDLDELELLTVPLTVSQLKELAGKWLKIVQAKTQQVVNTQIAVSVSNGDAEEAQRRRLTSLNSERNDLFDRYSAVINAWERKGGDVKEITVYRDYRDAIFIEETRKADFKTLIAWLANWAIDEDGGIAVGKNIAIVVLSFLALLVVARVVRGFVRQWIDHVPNISDLLQAFVVTIVYWLVLAVGLMVVLSALGVDITPLFALFGGASLIAAFAMQDTLSNFASGLMIMIYRPFDVGDYVDVGGVGGTVKSTTIVSTTVATPDNKIIVIPNKNVWGNIITNVTASDTRRVDLVFGISYDDSIADAFRVMEDAIEAQPLVLKDPKPTVEVNELGDSSVNLICRPWVKTSDYWKVYWDLMRGIKERFDAAGISMPYPQRDVHVIGAPTLEAPAQSQETRPASKASISEGDESN